MGAMASTTSPAPSWNPVEIPPFPARRFTVDEYHRLLDTGILDEAPRFELLEGWIVPKMTRKPPHDVVLGTLQDLLDSSKPAGWHLRAQMAITTADSEPEPDLALVRGIRRDYLDRHPAPEDLALVVEVSDSTVAEDRLWKGRIYARAGIPLYWLVNLADHRVEVYSDPSETEARYRQRHDFGPEADLPLTIEDHVHARLAVRLMLP